MSDAAESARQGGGDWARCFFEGKSVLVTGGTSGIGEGIARAFRDAGATVTATGVSASETAAAGARTGNEGIAHAVLDVRDGKAAASLLSEFASLDVLVNCAGVIRRLDELDPDIFADVVDINLNGAMRMASHARSLLAASGAGAIINLASMLSFQGGGLVPAYSASKGGIAQLTKSLAIAYADDAIRVNAVAPGWIATPLTAALQADGERSGAILGRTPMKRWGQPGDIAGGTLFLASPAAAFITGAILPIDGGYLIT